MSKFSHSELSQLPKSLYWKLIDLNTGLLYQDWKTMSNSNLRLSTYSINEISSLFKFLPKMKDAVIAVSTDKTTVIYHIHIKSLCETYPNNIKDLSNSNKQACVVEPSQLPTSEADCKEQHLNLQNWITDGLISCNIANRQLAKKKVALR